MTFYRRKKKKEKKTRPTYVQNVDIGTARDADSARSPLPICIALALKNFVANRGIGHNAAFGKTLKQRRGGGRGEEREEKLYRRRRDVYETDERVARTRRHGILGSGRAEGCYTTFTQPLARTCAR